MTDEVLEKTFANAVASERKITREILTYINMIEDRNIDLKRGCKSLHDYLIKVHKYSSGSASRRISAAKVLRAVPEVADKVQSGAVNLSSLCQAQIIMKRSKRTLTKEQKSEVVEEIANQTSDQVEKTLFELFPEAGQTKQESLKRVTNGMSRLSIDIPDQLRDNIQRLKELLAYTQADTIEVLTRSTEELLNQLDPLRQPEAKPKEEAKDVTPAMKRAIRQRDNDECQWRDPRTMKKCLSKYQIEVDHMIPRAHGGSNKADNLRCLCRRHNQLHAQEKFGAVAANRWRSATP